MVYLAIADVVTSIHLKLEVSFITDEEPLCFLCTSPLTSIRQNTGELIKAVNGKSDITALIHAVTCDQYNSVQRLQV